MKLGEWLAARPLRRPDWAHADLAQSSLTPSPAPDPWQSVRAVDPLVIAPQDAPIAACEKQHAERDTSLLQVQRPFPSPASADPWSFALPNTTVSAPTSEAGYPWHDLPRFDPRAGAQQPRSDPFDAPLRRGAAFRAHMVARGSSVVGEQALVRLRRALEEVFERWTHPATYKAWLNAAASIDDPETAALAAELKLLWDDTPAFWLHRVAPARARHSDAARGQFTWAAALRMARAQPDTLAAELVSHDMVLAWVELEEPCPGYWSFASYVEEQAKADLAEQHAFAVVRRSRAAQVFWRERSRSGSFL